jgi:hypothetical protein
MIHKMTPQQERTTLLVQLNEIEPLREQYRRQEDFDAYQIACEACMNLGRRIVLCEQQIAAEAEGRVC